MLLVVLKRTMSVVQKDDKDDDTEELMRVDSIEVQCPENIVRKKGKQMDLDYVINQIQNKLYF